VSRPPTAAMPLGDGPSRGRRRRPVACDYTRGRRRARIATRGGGDAMAYYANFGPASGPLRSAAGFYAIGVLPTRGARTPIGTALADGQDRDGRALWKLTIDTIELPGLYLVVDRQFRPAHRGDRGPREGGRGRGGAAGRRDQTWIRSRVWLRLDPAGAAGAHGRRAPGRWRTGPLARWPRPVPTTVAGRGPSSAGPPVRPDRTPRGPGRPARGPARGRGRCRGAVPGAGV
jgi:hypothetical protein